MLDVIITRGLPLDRITTTDVWATDTISANLPEMDAFKARMDERIWWKYRMEVEHLCARNKDGSKRTYEQMFYHVPQRKNSQTVQVERERERRAPARLDPRLPGSVEPLVSGWTQAEFQATEYRERLQDSLQTPGTTGVRSSKSPMQFRDSLCMEFHGAKVDSNPECRPQGFPAQISPWCRKLKIDFPSPMSARRGARTEISSNTWASQRTSPSGSNS